MGRCAGAPHGAWLLACLLTGDPVPELHRQQGGVPIGIATPWKLVQLDNTAPTPVDIQITSGAGSCGDFKPGDLIEGTYSASDNENLAGVSVGVEAAMPERHSPRP